MVDRAKGLLMDRHGLTEHEAFSFIQKHGHARAHRRCAIVAERVIAGDAARP